MRAHLCMAANSIQAANAAVRYAGDALLCDGGLACWTAGNGCSASLAGTPDTKTGQRLALALACTCLMCLVW